MRKPAARKTTFLFPIAEVEGFESLSEIALDMRWSWNHDADEIWKKLDPTLWELTHNPWVVLQTISRPTLEQAFSDPEFSSKVDELVQARRKTSETSAWFQQNYSQSSLTCAAYFSMEFMLSEALPIYSGGLGNVAGDQLKTASDLGVPVIGIGLLYQQGYFRQVLDKDGSQQAIFSYNDPSQLPITPLREPNGEWLRIEIFLPDYPIWLRCWQVQVGRARLFLLDSNDPANFPAHQGITGELYGGGPEMRLKQEIVLGIGGWRLLEALNVKPEVCHLNEGHTAFAILERARNFMKESGEPFETALAVTRAGNIFTTHTAVAAGFDRFPPALIKQYLGAYAHNLGLTIHDLLTLGRQNPDDEEEDFNMAFLAIRGSGVVNGVSRLHGEVSRRIFEPLFPRWPVQEIPVGHITNGVHVPSWDSAEADDLWMKACGKERWLGTVETLEQDIRKIPDAKLWQMRNTVRKNLIEYVRRRLPQQLIASGALPEEIESAQHILDPNALTLGFARRFATYKRPNLLLHNRERLIRMLINQDRPVQLILAGKAHPADQAGQAMIREWIHFMKNPEVKTHLIFLSDYDMLLTEQMVQGVDVWINTPRRPWEACGTSGMKILVNGGINLSELDGWWAEAYSPEVGWALGDGQEHGDDPSWDDVEAGALYDILEREVVPLFYMRNERGIPAAWITRIRESMAHLTPRFSANRTIREYTEKHYLQAAESYRRRAADSCKIGKQIAKWQDALKKKWAAVRFGELKFETDGKELVFHTSVFTGDLDPHSVRVQLYADGINGGSPILRDMVRERKIDGKEQVYSYKGRVPATRPAWHYTARVIPDFPDVCVPLEVSLILWQK